MAESVAKADNAAAAVEQETAPGKGQLDKQYWISEMLEK